MKIFFDCETDGLLDDMTRVHCIAMAVDDGDVCSYGPDELEEGIKELCAAALLVSHNLIGFDLPALAKYPNTRGITASGAKCHDTLLVSRLLYPDLREEDYRRMHTKEREGFPKELYGRHSLQAWGHRLGMEKGLYLKEHGFEEYTEEMAAYCRRDVEVLRMLYHNLEEGR